MKPRVTPMDPGPDADDLRVYLVEGAPGYWALVLIPMGSEGTEWEGTGREPPLCHFLQRVDGDGLPTMLDSPEWTASPTRPSEESVVESVLQAWEAEQRGKVP